MAERRCEDDGFGNSMELCNRHDCGLQVVRPGKFQCVLEECYRLRPEPTSSCQPKSSRYPIDPPQDDLTAERAAKLAAFELVKKLTNNAGMDPNDRWDKVNLLLAYRQTARQEALQEARDYALACVSERKAQAFELTKTVINDPRAVWLGCKASEAERIAEWLDRLEPGEANQVVLSRGRRME